MSDKKRYICLLRGINVGSTKRMLMDDLKNLFESLGFTNISTYIQSGNVVFSSDEHVDALKSKIENAITSKFGFQVDSLVFDEELLSFILSNNPFEQVASYSIDNLYVTIISETANSGAEQLLEPAAQGDLFKINGRAIYIYVKTKYSDSKLTNGFIEKKLKTSATTRNWKTLNQLYKMI